MRCFLALTLPDALRQQLALALEQAGDRPHNVRLVNERLWHVTLAFLGEVAEAAIEPVLKALTPETKRPGQLIFTQLESFPHRWPRLLVAHAQALPSLTWQRFVEEVREKVRPHCPNLDDKPWTGHVTLARAKRGETLSNWSSPIGPWTWQPAGFSLMQSTLGGLGGPIYRSLHDFTFLP